MSTRSAVSPTAATARDIWLRWSHYRGREDDDLSVDRMVPELTGEQ